ncbi:hypothetical protein G5I_12930 [Acromyrmex echinatior]|uniref:Uncharacterized protein n=1 Tax=Acromyrmex echinatior TaxID=103372 RepID=F4X3M2_ACREC|nr:hypothetical protein G5I_12930 [Acromyrmex echinatior]
MPPKRQGRRAELLLASPTAPECLVFAIGLRRIAARAFRRLLPKRIRMLRSVDNLKLTMDLITNCLQDRGKSVANDASDGAISHLGKVTAIAGEHVLDVYCPCTGVPIVPTVTQLARAYTDCGSAGWPVIKSPTVLRDSDYVPAYDLILLRNANDVEEGWMGFRSSEILRQGLEGGPIVLRARDFRKISALAGVTTPVTLFVPEKQQRPRPNAAPTFSFPPTAFAIKQKPLEIEFVRKKNKTLFLNKVYDISNLRKDMEML